MRHFHRYLPVSDEIRRHGLYVLAGGYTLIPPNSPYPPQTHPADHHFQWSRGRTLREYQMIYVARGEGVFESRSAGCRKIEAGALFMLFPGEWHRYSPDPRVGWDEYWVAFDGSHAATLVAESPLTHASPMVDAGVSDTLKEEFVRIADEMLGEQIGYQPIVAARAALILATACAFAERNSFAGNSIRPIVEHAMKHLSGKIDQDVNMEELAAELGVGYSRFRKEFRAYTGFSPARYHLELRLNHAINLLVMTSLPVMTVGERIGIDSPAYFSRLFKKKTGLTPGDYRSRSQKR